jgi:hypothetical protein
MATLELFGSSKNVIKFVFPEENGLNGKFWEYWKEWKRGCVDALMQGRWSHYNRDNFRILHADMLLLPGETY